MEGSFFVFIFFIKNFYFLDRIFLQKEHKNDRMKQMRNNLFCTR